MTTSLVFDKLNQDTRVSWPNEEWKMRGGKNKWGRWRPKNGMEGVIVHAWLPRHRETVRRSPIDRILLLMQIGNRFVPLSELAVELVSSADDAAKPTEDEEETSSKKES